ncbi:hypothetical protein ACFQU1_19150 [Chelatococcus sp. GCM10030263]|uniref:hypothetical protein n=1 Tax=Chelatococcus sp. GCM10030263 TaxID=3273387 RepID=UPI0036227176
MTSFLHRLSGGCRAAILGLALAGAATAPAWADDGFNLQAKAFLAALNGEAGLSSTKQRFVIDKTMAAPDGSSLIFFSGGDCVKGQGHATRQTVLLTFSVTIKDSCRDPSASVAPYLRAIVAVLEPTLIPGQIGPSVDALLTAARANPGKLVLRPIGGRPYGAAYDPEAALTTFIPYPTMN